MNYITNDYGQSVFAVGAPGSVERMKVERPRLISRLNSLSFEARAEGYYGMGVDLAIEMIRNADIESPLETMSILDASEYANERAGTVTGIVRAVS